MNDSDREEWVYNDEHLYNWWLSSGIGIKAFVKANRHQLTEYINRKLGR